MSKNLNLTREAHWHKEDASPDNTETITAIELQDTFSKNDVALAALF